MSGVGDTLMVLSVEVRLILLYSHYTHITARYIHKVNIREEVDPHKEANSLHTRERMNTRMQLHTMKADTHDEAEHPERGKYTRGGEIRTRRSTAGGEWCGKYAPGVKSYTQK